MLAGAVQLFSSVVIFLSHFFIRDGWVGKTAASGATYAYWALISQLCLYNLLIRAQCFAIAAHLFAARATLYIEPLTPFFFLQTSLGTRTF